MRKRRIREPKKSVAARKKTAAKAPARKRGASATVRRPKSPTEGISCISFRGTFKVELIRKNKVIATRKFRNGVVNEGKNSALDVIFNDATNFFPWHLGLIDNSGFSALASDDIYDDINQAGNGWDEFDDYTDPANADSAVTRPEWTSGAASGQAVTNSSVVVFDITGSGTVKGLFACAGANADTKGDHTASGNVLWATALFTGGDVAVTSGDQLKVTYTVTA